jgi:hypothetical protein
MTAEIYRDHPAALGKVSNLGREDPMVAGPTVDEKQRRAFGSTRSRLEMREPHSVARQKNRLYSTVVRHRRILSFIVFRIGIVVRSIPVLSRHRAALIE